MPELITPQGKHSISAILFDKDGTLLQFISLWGSWSECFLEQFTCQLAGRGLEFPVQHRASLLGTVHDAGGRITGYDRNGPLAMGTMSDLYAILSWQGYLLGLSWAESMELVELCRQEADALLERSRPVLPLPGLLRFLDQCAASGVALAVVTADETAAAENHLRWLGIRGYFSAVIGTDQVERGKPFPDMALLACEQLGVQPAEAAVIGDTNGDMRMAKAAGAAVAVGIAGTASVAAADRGISGVTGTVVDTGVTGAADPVTGITNAAGTGAYGVITDAVNTAGYGTIMDTVDTAANGGIMDTVDTAVNGGIMDTLDTAANDGITNAGNAVAARYLLPDADCIVKSYAELSIGRNAR
ncbi:HAD family hydrolase [Paenibacillus graminis]|uniref:HAD family hydrolase n=2 Tax=Paenibacillus graminis TaxID=189425 RepID=UPI000693CF27|nr:HAD family hydrolase [Paenibacillus graminis]